MTARYLVIDRGTRSGFLEKTKAMFKRTEVLFRRPQKKSFLIMALLGSLATVIGCTSELKNEIDRQMVIGKYVANHQKGEDTLELRPDGSYVYQYVALDGKTFKNINKWEFEYSNGKPMITF